MAASNSTLTQARLKELLHYDPNTGILTNLVRRSNNARKGDVAGWIHRYPNGKQYKYVGINNTQHKAHRLIWLYMTGSFPQDQIDHADGNGLNNIFSNLSSVTNLENSKNHRLQSNNISGIPGVWWCKGRNRWEAHIKVNNIKINLGRFVDFFEACCIRKSAETKYGFHPNHGSVRPL